MEPDCRTTFSKKINLLLMVITCNLLLLSSKVSAESPPSLMDIYKTLSNKKMIDLTQSLSSEIPVWSGFREAIISAAADPITHEPYQIEKHGFRSNFFSMVGQYGTHVDPPAHFDLKGMTLDKIPLNQMILPLIIFDDTQYYPKDKNHGLSVKDIKDWEIKNGRIPKGSFAALRTDMYKDWKVKPERFKSHSFPSWTLDAIKFLILERDVIAIGHEALDTDTTEKLDSETWLLKRGHYQIEAMANLDKVPEKGSLIIVTWPKIENGFGFPARAFAILP